MAEEFHIYLQTPAGILKIEAGEEELAGVSFLPNSEPVKERPNELCEEARFQLKAYFDGKLREFDLPLRQIGTDFQKKVWRRLQEIPYGKSISYSRLAKDLGDPNYVRAVGAANGKNPLAVVVPCHRVVGATGSLVGYAWGLHRKRWLLDFEGQCAGGQLEMF